MKIAAHLFFATFAALLGAGCICETYRLKDAELEDIGEAKPYYIETIVNGDDYNGFAETMSEHYGAKYVGKYSRERTRGYNPAINVEENTGAIALDGEKALGMPIAISLNLARNDENSKTADNDTLAGWNLFGTVITLGLLPCWETYEYDLAIEISTPYTKTGFKKIPGFTVQEIERAWILPLPVFFDGGNPTDNLVNLDSDKSKTWWYNRQSAKPVAVCGLEKALREARLEEVAARYNRQMKRIVQADSSGDWEEVVKESEGLNTRRVNALRQKALTNIEKRRVEKKLAEIEGASLKNEWEKVLSMCEGEKGEAFDKYRKAASDYFKKLEIEKEARRVEAKLAKIEELEKDGDWEAALKECEGEADSRIKVKAEIATREIMKKSSAALWDQFERLCAAEKTRMQKEELWKKYLLGKRVLLKGVMIDADKTVVFTVGGGKVLLCLLPEERSKIIDIEPGREVWFSGQFSRWDCGKRAICILENGRLGDENIRAGSSRSLGQVFSDNGGRDILGNAFAGALLGADMGDELVAETLKAAVKTGVEIYNMSSEEQENMLNDAIDGLDRTFEALELLCK